MAEEKEGEEDEDVFHDGAWEENGPAFATRDQLEEVLILDPDVADDEKPDVEEEDRACEAIEPYMKEAAALTEAVRGEVTVPEGGVHHRRFGA